MGERIRGGKHTHRAWMMYRSLAKRNDRVGRRIYKRTTKQASERNEKSNPLVHIEAHERNERRKRKEQRHSSQIKNPCWSFFSIHVNPSFPGRSQITTQSFSIVSELVGFGCFSKECKLVVGGNSLSRYGLLYHLPIFPRPLSRCRFPRPFHSLSFLSLFTPRKGRGGTAAGSPIHAMHTLKSDASRGTHI